jgi:TatD DNase family protein
MIIGVITYSSNQNTSEVIRHLATGRPNDASLSPLRILLETDAPYMVPANITPQTLGLKSGQKLPFSHSGMIPWTAEFVANVAGEGWDAERVLAVARENARAVYGI